MELAQLMDAVVNVAETPLTYIYAGDCRCTYSRRSNRSSNSTVNYKRKEGCVKLKTGIFAEEREAERYRISVENRREFEEIERKVKMEKRQAENRLE